MAREGAQNRLDHDARRGLFDVLARHSGRILLAVYVIWASLAGLLTYARIATAEKPPLSWPEIVIIGVISTAVTVGIAIPLAFGVMEGIPMVLAELRKRLWREEARREGRVEGIKENQQVWEAWLERREAAEREGRSFTEPPPSLNGTNGEDNH